MTMFCYQCEQTAKGTGCEVRGVCGKDPETAALQDLLVHAATGLSQYAHRARGLGLADPEVDRAVVEALFVTVTNVSFDPGRIEEEIRRIAGLTARMREAYLRSCREAGQEPELPGGPATWQPAADREGLLVQARGIGIANRLESRGADLTGLEELILYGLKGTAAYADHALILGRSDPAIGHIPIVSCQIEG